MSHSPHPIPKNQAPQPPRGPLDWRSLVQWLQADGVISTQESTRIVNRCAQAESAQHPLVRLAAVTVRRASDDKPMDIDQLTQWLASRTGLAYLRIDPLKVDVSKVADTMSPAYAERHRILPVQVTAHEVVVATAEPFLTDWVAEVERQSRRSVRRVVANPQDIHRLRSNFLRLPSLFARQPRRATTPVQALSNWSNWARATASWMPTIRVWSRWWTGFGSMLLTSAPATFTWSHGVSRA